MNDKGHYRSFGKSERLQSGRRCRDIAELATFD
jgi:hypothetical protein